MCIFIKKDILILYIRVDQIKILVFVDFHSFFIFYHMDLDNLNRNIDALDKKIDEWRTNLSKENQSTQKLLKRVLEEVKLGASSGTVKRKKIIPQKPFSEVHEFSEFEAKIQSSENKYNGLVAELQTIICASTTKFIKMAWRKIITDNVAQSYSWQGTKTKTPARALSVTGALKRNYAYEHMLWL
ncbi:uncharacterized protein [Eurosta solidaginis]|uniref:uncharacterized protein isoform X1 n=2 Tax=Eurosta solidaginis TaxID=178769 RepID=UPI003530E7A9